jgi:hypothetical protein
LSAIGGVCHDEAMSARVVLASIAVLAAACGWGNERDTPRGVGGPGPSVVAAGSSSSGSGGASGGGSGPGGNGGSGGVAGAGSCDDSGFCDACSSCAFAGECADESIECQNDGECNQALGCLRDCGASCVGNDVCYLNCRGDCADLEPGYEAALNVLDCFCTGACTGDCSPYVDNDCIDFLP